MITAIIGNKGLLAPTAMMMTRATVMRLATCLAAGGLCHCELPDAEYFAQKWEEPRVVFDAPKWQLEETAAMPPTLDAGEFPPLPYMSPELPLADGAARLTPPVADSRAASLLPTVADTMAADRDFDVVAIPEWKQEEVKAAQPAPPSPVKSPAVVSAGGTTATAGAALPPPPQTTPPMPPPAAVSIKEEPKPGGTPPGKPEAGAKVTVGESAAPANPPTNAPTPAPAPTAGKTEPEKVKIAGGAPGLALIKPVPSAAAGGELGGKSTTPGAEGGGAVTEPTAGSVVRPAGEIPEGLPVEGRPGLVRSPYGQPHQLVDVSDLKPGDLIKCPFSGKAFRVPKEGTAGSTAIKRTEGETAPPK